MQPILDRVRCISPPRELEWVVIAARGHVQGIQQIQDPPGVTWRTSPLDPQRQAHVLGDGQGRDQVEELEHHSDAAAPQPGTRILDFSASASATALVESDESDAREGMPDLDRTFDVGPALSLLLSNPARADSLWSRVALRTAVSLDTDDWDLTQRGWNLDARLRYQRPLRGDLLRLALEVGASMGDRTYLGYFYDVPATYATAERDAYRSDGGYAGARLGAGLSGVYGRWRWSLYGAYLNLSGTGFAGSPLLTSEHDFSLGATLGWMFWKSERRVEPKNTSPGGEFDAPLFGR